jgi:hypothetical protein
MEKRGEAGRVEEEETGDKKTVLKKNKKNKTRKRESKRER